MKFMTSSNLVLSGNWTLQTNEHNRTEELDWIIPVATNIFLFVATLWVLVSLIHYGIKTKKWKKRRGTTSEKLNAGTVYSFVIVCAVMCLFRYSTSLVLMNIGFNDKEDLLCDVAADVAYGSYALVLYSGAFFLWFRQRNFYASRMFDVVYSLWIRVLSFGSIFVIVFSGISVIAYNIIPMNYHSSKYGCVYKPNTNLQTSYWISAVTIIVVNHLVLVGLFVYALIYLKRLDDKAIDGKAKASNKNNEKRCIETEKQTLESAKRSLANSAYGSRISSSSLPGSSNKIKIILQKTLTFALLSISCDILIQVVAHYIVNRDSHRRVSLILFDVSAFLNLLFLLMSFVTFKEMLTSPCLKSNQSR